MLFKKQSAVVLIVSLASAMLATTVGTAQATNSTPVSWVHQLGSNSGDTITATTVDAAGYVYIVGNASGVASGTLASIGVTGTNVSYIGKFHPDGAPVWTKVVPLAGTSRSLQSIAVDANGNVFVSGVQNASLILGGSIPDLINSNLAASVFIAKFDPDGNAVASTWLYNPRNTLVQADSQIRVDTAGNVYAAASTHSALKLSYAKFTNNLSNTWIRSFDGNTSYGVSMNSSAFAVNQASGEVYIGGYFKSTIAFSSSVSLTSSGPGLNGYVLKLDNLGEPIWAKRFVASVSDASLTGLSVDSSGHVFASGFSSGTVTFPDGSATTATSIPAGSNFPDSFAVKLDSSGTLVWKSTWGGTSDDRTYGITVASDGKSYVTGKFRVASTFGSFDAQVAGYPSNAATDAYALELSPTGSINWVQTFGGPSGTTQIESFTANPSVLGSQVFVGGTAESVSQGASLTTLGGGDGYFVAIGRDALPAHSFLGSDGVLPSTVASLVSRPAATSTPTPTFSSPSPSSSPLPVEPPVYSGPVFDPIVVRKINSITGGTVVIRGIRMDTISSVAIAGLKLEATSKTSTELSLLVPPGKPGEAELDVVFANGRMTWSNAFTYVDPAVEQAALLNRQPKADKPKKVIKPKKPKPKR